MGLLILIAFGSGFYKVIHHHPATTFQVSFYSINTGQEPRFESRFVSSKLHTQTHAASLVELKDGRLRAFWFAGSREGASDVQIKSAVFDPKNGKWGAEQLVVTRGNTQQDVLRYVSKLGNPVCGRAPNGDLWLFYVTVSLGGWSGSSITMKTSTDEGKTWSAARRLVTSPFLNISTLVKGTPFYYGDGTMGLPVYHELINKFGEILHLDEQGNVIDLQRLSAAQDHGLQPVVLVKSTFEAQALMRSSSDKEPRQVLSVATRDGGQHWTEPEELPLLNPDSALTAVVLPDGRILGVFNNQERQGISKGRDVLSLMISEDDGNSWKLVKRLEDQSSMRGKAHNKAAFVTHFSQLAQQTEPQSADEIKGYVESTSSAMCGDDGCGFEFSYPYLIQASNGDFHLVYTWNRSFIKYIRFNGAWLKEQLQQ